ncbi:response regulator, partial [Hungatella effluvii]
MMRIVVVEDEIRIREGISRLLKKLNEEYEIVGAAENGQEGLALIRELKPDVVITDIRMPVMDGLEMLDRLYQENAGTKAIVLSAYSEFEYARKAMQSGV